MIRQPFTHSGKVKAQYLVGELSADLIRELKETGLESEDIWNISYLMAAEKNTFHSQEKRRIKKIELQLQVQPKGRDYDWMYGFAKKMVRKDIGTTPQQRNFTWLNLITMNRLGCKFVIVQTYDFLINFSI